MNKIESLQSLRALAILLVMLHHARTYYEAMGGNNFYLKTAAEYGYIGVDIFFVLSGFVIFGAISRIPQTPDHAVRFLKTRMVRIFPFYWMILPLYVVTTANRTIDIPGSILLLQANPNLLVMGVSWSLAGEFIFYLMIGLCCLLGIRYIGFLLFYSSIILANQYLWGYSDNTFLLNPLLLEFVIGVLIAWKIHPAIQQLRYKKTGASFFLCAAFITLYTGTEFTLEAGMPRVFFCGLTGGLLLTAALCIEWGRSRLLSVVPRIGDASFALYLLHVLVLIVCSAVGIVAFFKEMQQPDLGLFVLLSINTLVGMYWYFRIEHPLYKKLKTKIGQPPALANPAYRKPQA